MRISSGNMASPLELINPYKKTWRLKWNKWSDDRGDHWFEEDLKDVPTIEQIKTIINEFYNEKAQKEILTAFVYNDAAIWLSAENQMNYKSLFDLKAEENIIKTSDGSYITFRTFNEYADFYYSMILHIQNTLLKYWKLKDEFDYSEYIRIINENN